MAVGTAATLDGSGSSDPDGDALSFSWSLQGKPSGSSASLRSVHKAKASLTPDVAGSYSVKLTVADGHGYHATDSATVQAGKPPTANAGSDQVVAVGASVQLDGRGSSASGGASLSYAWTFQARPSGSAAALDNAASATPHFTADVAGSYRLQLTVDNGFQKARDTVTVRANRPPTADAGADQTGRVGQEVVLNGSGSSDPDGDVLSYAWSFVGAPSGSTAALQDANSVSASFTPDVSGSYIVQLTVDDGAARSSDRVSISVADAGGATSSVLYVAPSGDDANPGTQASPLATVGAALSDAASNSDIQRIVLAAGSYAEAFGQTVGRALQIVGPLDTTTHAVLRQPGGATSPLLTADGGYLTLLRVSLDAPGTAVKVAASDGSGLALVNVSCTALICVDNGKALSLEHADLSAASPGTGNGVRSKVSTGVTIADSTVSGFGTGISFAGPANSVGIQNTSFNNDGTGLLVNQDSNDLSVQNCTFLLDGTGIRAVSARRLRIAGGTHVTGSTGTGVQVAVAGSVLLDDVTIFKGDATGLSVDQGHPGGSTSVTVRNSHINGNALDGVAVFGQASSLDLGSPGHAAANDVTANRGYALHDARGAGATGAITVNGTHMASPDAPAMTYTGPYTGYGMSIDNGTKVIVY